jgi:hypothetical protein
MAPPSQMLSAILFCLVALVSGAPSAFAAGSGDVLSSGAGSITSDGTLDPIGDGRFRVSGREYSLRLSGEDSSGCFRGSVRASEEAVLSVPHYAGTHGGSISVVSENGTLLISYRGTVDRYTGRGDWSVVRGTGACADVGGSGTYVSVLRASTDSEFRIDLRGRFNDAG